MSVADHQAYEQMMQVEAQKPVLKVLCCEHCRSIFDDEVISGSKVITCPYCLKLAFTEKPPLENHTFSQGQVLKLEQGDMCDESYCFSLAFQGDKKCSKHARVSK